MRSNRMIKMAGVLLASTVLFAASANAQSSATGNIAVSATVGAALTSADVQGLSFGTLLPGVNKTIATTDGLAGQVRFNGVSGATVSLSFGSLLALTGTAGSLTISYAAAHAATSTGTQTSFDPAIGTTAVLSAGELWVFLGGTVSPTVTQAAGSYGNTVTVTATYTSI